MARLLCIQDEVTILRNEKQRLEMRDNDRKDVNTKLKQQCQDYEYEIFQLEKTNNELRVRIVPDHPNSRLRR